MKSVGETKAIRIYPMKDATYKIMWKIHPPKSCLSKFDKEDWAKNDNELLNKIKKLGKYILSN
jgi:hypothetical protein